MKQQVNLVQWIKDNPNAVFVVDNDCWHGYPDGSFIDDEDATPAVCDSTVVPIGDGGYGSGSRYGGDILQALAAIVGVKVESV